MDLSVFFAGTAGAAPTARRGLPAVLIRRGGDRILVDCGEGTQRQLLRSAGLPDIGLILLTHHHVDHWLGLPGMLKTFALRDRTAPLDVFGPPGTRKLFDATRFIYGRLPFDLVVTDLDIGDEVAFDDYVFQPIRVRHRGLAYGYALIEDERPGRFDAERAIALGVAEGPDFGRLQAGETVSGVRPDDVIGPARPGRTVVLSGDTGPCDMVREAARGADLLVHEATFTDEDRERAAETGHSTATQAAQLAAEAGVRMLALTHVSMRYAGPEIRDEARAIFPATELPRDFDTIDVPFAERGAPTLTRWERGSSGTAATVIEGSFNPVP